MSVCDPIRAKNYLITWPHCDVKNEDILNEIIIREKLVEKGIKYIILSKEFHQDGEEHHHMFISFEAPLKLKREDMNTFDLNKDDRTFHANIKSVKSPKDAINYVKKEGTYITYGRCPYNIPLSTKEKNELLSTQDLNKLVEDGTVSIFKIPTLQRARDILRLESQRRKKAEKPTVHWFYGETGTGKTFSAYDAAIARFGEMGTWISQRDDKWFDGYIGQQGVILDDIRPSTFNFSFMLRLLDRYPIEVPIKGGFASWRPKEIWVTAPGTPRELYRNYTTKEPYEGIEQLERRIDDLREFTIRRDEGGEETKEDKNKEDTHDEVAEILASWPSAEPQK